MNRPTIDEEALQRARDVLCETWGIPSLRQHQEKAGRNIIQGISTIYDVPTGGGKTLSFWYPLFYHSELNPQSRKVVLVISPLNALMDAQVKDLLDKGIQAVALNSSSKAEELFEHQVILTSPETALKSSFHEKLLKTDEFKSACVSVVVDEAHCIAEWGGDFRPHYDAVGKLLARCPSHVPVLIASATMPQDVRELIAEKLDLGENYDLVAVSNAKPNVGLSVRVIQHPIQTYADLLFLFPNDTNPEDFKQTLIYVNTRKEAEAIQDFLRAHCPPTMSPDTIEFYHRNIGNRKTEVEEKLRSGYLKIVIATDTLGMGMDFKNVLRVVLWLEPRSFLSFVQKVGRCARSPHDIGQAILFVTRASMARHVSDFDRDEASDDENGEDRAEIDEEIIDRAMDPVDREAVIDEDEPEYNSGSDAEPDPDLVVKRKRCKVKSAREARDLAYLTFIIATNRCRHLPWDEFFGNHAKMPLFPEPQELDVPCCDNCAPRYFPIERISLRLPYPTWAGRSSKPTEQLQTELEAALKQWRTHVIVQDYLDQRNVTSRQILSDATLAKIVARPAVVERFGSDVFRHIIPWQWATRYGNQVIAIVKWHLALYPDPEQRRREEAAERQHASIAEKDRRNRLVALFHECYNAVHDLETGEVGARGRGKDKKEVRELKCEPFLRLPSSKHWPDYYKIIKTPISMAHINRMMKMKAESGYASLSQYVDAWQIMFANARTFNREDSDIYRTADELESFFNKKLSELALKYEIELPEAFILS
ncbi:hypothetical protein D9758_015587 [Tetrapyrgos nigripes]|uniref:DNA 3'-5' helicase n=1 Tax=Tetrapyrgos nigripes TaxID=182062 RepID=A0A8H5CD57_9AGAR|nr:hypothetical protein D9758_015587 [Tetrapyrgos nigripes]